MTIPLLPDSMTYQELGGSRRDYSAPENPETDYLAEEINAALHNVAVMSRTVPRAWVKLKIGTSYAIQDYESVWKTNDPSYSVARGGTGVYYINVPSSITDEQGNSHAPNLRFATATIVSGDFGFVKCSVSGYTITLSTASTAGAASDLSDAVICIEVA